MSRKSKFNKPSHSERIVHNYPIKAEEEDPNNCRICDHEIVQHDSYGCLMCFPTAACNLTVLVTVIGKWKVTISETGIKSERMQSNENHKKAD